MSLRFNLEKYTNAIDDLKTSQDIGKITQVTGQMMRGYIPGACMGSVCSIHPMVGKRPFLAEVVGFEGRSVLLMPLGEMLGVGLGARIELQKTRASVPVGEGFLGRIIDGLGNPIDNAGKLLTFEESSLYNEGINPLSRPPISEQLSLGVRSIDGLLSIGKGQRVGIMAGSGVGKSMLMGMIARSTQADINVIALIGERGREVREFVEENLGPEGLKKSVVVAVTSDQSALMRMRGAFFATTLAEYFSARGKDVLLMMDSVTRFAMAQREIGLSVGEPPASKGYTPSVFGILPRLLERAGTFERQGSITGLYTVLVEGDDPDDPIGDAVRSIVDGHIVLDRKLAQRGHFPAIDILQSTSRVMRNVVTPDQVRKAQWFREQISVYQEAEDLINIGAYKQGSNPQVDRAIQMHEPIDNFLRQDFEESSNLDETYQVMAQVQGDGS